jgi:hypothetical protein
MLDEPDPIWRGQIELIGHAIDQIVIPDFIKTLIHLRGLGQFQMGICIDLPVQAASKGGIILRVDTVQVLPQPLGLLNAQVGQTIVIFLGCGGRIGLAVTDECDD